MKAVSIGAPAREAGFDLGHLRAQTLPLVLGAMVAPAIGLIVLAAMRRGPVEPELIGIIAALFLVAGLARAAARSRPRAGMALAVVGLLAIAVLGATVWPGAALVPWLGLVVPIAAALLGWRWAGAVALAALGATFLAAGGEHGLDPGTLSLAPLPLASLVVYWLLSRPVHTALEWAWASYLRAERLTEEARERQAELARLSKSLNETCYQLEVVNHELERARRAAEEAHRVKAEFAAAISHELRTPLNLIIGFSEMMVIAPHTYHDEVLPEGYRGDVQAIYRSACHLSSLVDDVLDLAEVEAHRMALEKEWVPLDRIAEEALATVATLFKDRNLSLTIERPDDLPALYVDRTRIRQVLINLLTNAARFTSQGGATVRARSDGRDVVVSVQDTGIGIPPTRCRRCSSRSTTRAARRPVLTAAAASGWRSAAGSSRCTAARSGSRAGSRVPGAGCRVPGAGCPLGGAGRCAARGARSRSAYRSARRSSPRRRARSGRPGHARRRASRSRSSPWSRPTTDGPPSSSATSTATGSSGSTTSTRSVPWPSAARSARSSWRRRAPRSRAGGGTPPARSGACRSSPAPSGPAATTAWDRASRSTWSSRSTASNCARLSPRSAGRSPRSRSSTTTRRWSGSCRGWSARSPAATGSPPPPTAPRRWRCSGRGRRTSSCSIC